MSSSGVTTDIKSKLGVVDVVGESVALKRAGSVYKGLCPFHSEKTPSLIVSPDRETWHCFGCGEGGDIFSFVMRRDGLDFREALERLAERAGVELSERTAREDRRRKRLREALEAAITWYREVLLRTPQAEAARAYLAERQLSDETLERFGIGFAPASWEMLTGRLRGRGFSEEELIGAGLASPSNRGGVIDKFRGRIIIPIRDQSGRAIGLGGRILPGTDGPKYLNSPATPLFDKSRVLYAIDLAKSSIRREKLAVIVEGYTDVMAAHQAGFTNVVASLGTALTHGQIELAQRYADGIALAYDVDLAGEVATQRGLLAELGPDQSVSKVRVVRVPAGKDPDELIRHEPDAWRAAVADAKPVVEYFMDRVAREVDLDTVAGKRELTGRVLALLRRVADPIERALYLQRLARMVNVEERVLTEALAQAPATLRGAPSPTSVPAPAAVGPSLGRLEVEALQLLLRHPPLAVRLDIGLDGEGRLPFRDASALSLIEAWRAWLADTVEGGRDIEGFVASLDPATAALARSLLAGLADGNSELRLDPVAAQEAFRVCLLRLRSLRIDEAIRDGRLLLEEAQRDDDRGRLKEIERRIVELAREKDEVDKARQSPALAGTRRN
jgi:DNA primase